MRWVYPSPLPKHLQPPKSLCLFFWYAANAFWLFDVIGTFISRGLIAAAGPFTIGFLVIQVSRALLLSAYAKIVLYKTRRDIQAR